MPVVRTSSTAVFACRSAVCRPPTSGGTGGSVKGSGLPNGADPDRHAKQIMHEMGSGIGVLAATSPNADAMREATTTLWGRVIPSDPIVRVRVSADEAMLRSIFGDGRLKSQHESGTSGGTFDPGLRESIEHTMFRVKGSNPIYGYLAEKTLSHKERTLPNYLGLYGGISLELKPGVLRRTTITVGDSLQGDVAPIRVGDVKTASPERLLAATSAVRSAMRQRIKDVGMSGEEAGRYIADNGWHGYVETQIHGGVSLKDVARVIIPNTYPDAIALVRSLAPDLEIVVIGDNEQFSIRALVAACHSAACRPPTSGGTGGSSPEGAPSVDSHVPGRWTRVVSDAETRFEQFLKHNGYYTDPLWKGVSREKMRRQFDGWEAGSKRSKEDRVEYHNGPLRVTVPLDMNQAAVDRMLSRLDRLQERFPAVGKGTEIHVTDDFDNPRVWGTTLAARHDDGIGVIRLRRSILEGEEPPASFGAQPGFFQNSVPVSAAEWTLTHEWGHAVDPRPMKQEPVSLWANGNRKGLSAYAQKLTVEGYAESFADWVTSKGQSTNEATRLYAQYHKWPAP